MRITWNACDWLTDEQRRDVEARLEKLDEEGGADRAEIACRTLELDQADWMEVRVTGVARKCQLTAVRENPDPLRALTDAIEAFERSVSYITGFSPREMRDARRDPASAPGAGSAATAAPARSAPRAATTRRVRKRKARSRPSRLRTGPLLSAIAVLAVVGVGAWWYQMPQRIITRLPVDEGPVAYRAVAGGEAFADGSTRFSAVAGSNDR